MSLVDITTKALQESFMNLPRLRARKQRLSGVDPLAPRVRDVLTAAEREAVRELNQFSDEELTDLDLSRAGIVDAVRFGRPGIDRKAA